MTADEAAAIWAIAPDRHHWFSADGRAVQRVYTSPQCDVLLVCWEPGQATSHHDHDLSESVVVLLEGEVVVGSGTEERRARATEVVITPQGASHQMRNDGPERAVTLHIYAPPLTGGVSQPYVDRTI